MLINKKVFDFSRNYSRNVKLHLEKCYECPYEFYSDDCKVYNNKKSFDTHFWKIEHFFEVHEISIDF